MSARLTRVAPFDRGSATAPRRTFRMITAATVALLAIGSFTACATPSTSEGPSDSPVAKDVKPISVLMGFKYSVVQWYALYDYGKAMGFFAKHGTDPTFQEGAGSAAGVTLIASGKTDLGAVVSTANVIQGVDSGAEIKMVGQDTPVGTIAVLSTKETNISSPAELQGKRIGYDPTSYAGILFKALLAANNVPEGSVEQVSVSGNAYATSLKLGTIDGYISAPDTNVPVLESVGVSDPTVMDFAKFGINAAPQEGIVASTAVLKEKGPLIKDFLAGLNETIEYLLAHPEAISDAAAAGVKAHPGVIEQDVAEAQLKLHMGFVQSGYTEGTSPLKIDGDTFQSQVDLLAKYEQIKNPESADHYYTNDYVPNS